MGEKYFRNKKDSLMKGIAPDYSIYVPRSWCAGHNSSSRPCDEPSASAEGGDL